MTQRFEGRVALVTGSAQGIGLAAAARLASEGARVFGLDVHEPDDAVEGVTNLVGDVTDLTEWQRAFAVAMEVGPVDVLVNNAGMVGSYEGIIDITLEDWDRVVKLNQTGVFYGMRTVLPSWWSEAGAPS